MTSRSIRGLALALAAGTPTACESATRPADSVPFDAGAALADYEALDAILASDGWRGFRAMGRTVDPGTFGQAAGLVLSAASELEVFRSAGDARAFASLLSAGGPVLAASPILSAFNRGRTFVYDAELGRYVADPDRTGAPATGVRFIIYREASGRPDPSREIGYADLIDEGDDSAEDIALRLVVVNDDRAVLDYRTTLDEQSGTCTITVDGTLRGDPDELVFDIEVQGSNGTGGSVLDVGFRMSVPNRGYEIHGSVLGTGQGQSEAGDVDVTLRHGSHALRVEMSGTETSLAGTVYLNETPYVLVAGAKDAPVFTRPDGGLLTGVEFLVLRHVIDVVEDVFDLFEDLMDPIDELVILAVIL